MDYNALKIEDFEYWSLYLNEYQCYLGRVYIVAKRKDAMDFLEMTQNETLEFFEIAKKTKKVLSDLFQPDLMNYASLGNIFKHLHVHLVPRYKAKRVFNGIEFEDVRWGQNYAPYNQEFKLSLPILIEIKEKIKNHLDFNSSL